MAEWWVRWRWVVIGGAVLVAAVVIIGALQPDDEKRDAYDACVDLADDSLLYSSRFEPEPLDGAEVVESPDGLRVEVYIEATVGRSDASGTWACGVNDEGEIVGVDSPAI